MSPFPEGNAIIYCEGAFATPNGKTAHGLVRRTDRYVVLSVVDSNYSGMDAGTILDGIPKGIPIHGNIRESVESFNIAGSPAHYLVMGIAPDGGRLGPQGRKDVTDAISMGLHIDSGLHDFLSEDEEISSLGERHEIMIRDIRKTPSRKDLHFFTGKIEEVTSMKIAVLGTDSAIGKRTTAWILTDALRHASYRTEFIGTGQTAWMQGARYCLILDSLINDFVSGEIEHTIWTAWKETNPEIIVIEGQGSLMNPAYPGGFEILAAGRPDVIILQHAPARKDYDGFPGYPIHSLNEQIDAIELISGIPVVAITINHENMEKEQIPRICNEIRHDTRLPAYDVLVEGAGVLVDILKKWINRKS
jgi:uncharacterized NAD-dependent epimerase/dehydratase family protein